MILMSIAWFSEYSAMNFIPDVGSSEYCHVLECESRWDFRLEIGFIDHFNTRLVDTFDYSTIADFHTLRIATAHANSFQSAVSSPVVLW
jgi:hypothetical protein